ncbi:MAG: nitrogenase component 1 [Peptococcaceae bacterium]|jgi:hypothetical protein|nr:nitrogenase component 1 [Peptococcaceae bacterium]
MVQTTQHQVQLFSQRRREHLLPSVPETQCLVIGPIECIRHCAKHALGRENTAALCLPDTEMVLGNTANLVVEAVRELYAEAKVKPRGFFLYTGCQTRFIGVDFDGIIREIQNTMPVRATHLEQVTFVAAHQSRAPASAVAESVYRLLPEGKSSGKAGVLLLNGYPLFSNENDLQQYFRVNRLSLRNAYGWRNFDDFLSTGDASLTLVTDPEMLPAAEGISKRRQIPYVYLPLSYRLSEIQEAYERLDEQFGVKTDMSEFASQAKTAIEQIQAQLGPCRLALDERGAARPWNTSRALLEYAFSLGAVSVTTNLPDDEDEAENDYNSSELTGSVKENDADYQWLVQTHPEVTVYEEQEEHGHGSRARSGGDGTSRGRRDQRGERGGAEEIVAGEKSFWGYAALHQLAFQLRGPAEGRDGQ